MFDHQNFDSPFHDFEQHLHGAEFSRAQKISQRKIELSNLAAQGYTVSQVASRWGLSKQRISQLAKQYKVDFSANSATLQHELNNIAWVRRYAAQGLSIHEVGATLGMTAQTIKIWAQRHGIAFRPVTWKTRTLVG